MDFFVGFFRIQIHVEWDPNDFFWYFRKNGQKYFKKNLRYNGKNFHNSAYSLLDPRSKVLKPS